MSTLSRAEVDAAIDLPTREVYVEPFGGTILVRAVPVASARYIAYINGPQRVFNDDGKASWREPTAEEKRIRQIVGGAILAALNPDGTRMFKWDDANRLRERHYQALVAIAEAGFELATLDTSDGLDEAKKDSGPTPN